MRIAEIVDYATQSLWKINENVVASSPMQSMPFKYLYHATRESNLPALKQQGLLTRYYGVVHGGMDIHPPKPSIYLSRYLKSNNLHTDLFGQGPVIVLKIDTRYLDQNELWPDDFIYHLWAEEQILAQPSSVARAFGCPIQQAKEIFAQLEQASNAQLPILLKPFWRWYLLLRSGGEVAYTADIPPQAIASVSPY